MQQAALGASGDSGGIPDVGSFGAGANAWHKTSAAAVRLSACEPSSIFVERGCTGTLRVTYERFGSRVVVVS